MINKILEKIDRISDFAHGAYCASGNEAFNLIYSYLTQLKILINEPELKAKEQLLSKVIEELNLSTRTIRMLKVFNIITIHDLTLCTWKSLCEHPNFGNKSLQEVQNALHEVGLELKGD